MVGHAGVADGDAALPLHHDLAPAEPLGEVAVGVGRRPVRLPPGGQCPGQVRFQAQRRQAALPRHEGGRAVGDGQAHRLPADDEAQVAHQAGQGGVEEGVRLGRGELPIAVGVELLHLLEGRNLRVVEDIGEAHRLGGEGEATVVVDGEVAERVRRHPVRRQGAGQQQRAQRE